MGASNVLGSFMSSFVSTASLSRSLVQETAGCVTQVNNIFPSLNVFRMGHLVVIIYSNL